MKKFLTKPCSYSECAVVTEALCFLVIPTTSFANPSDRDGDGTPDHTDICPDDVNHYQCLTAAGLWKWPAIAKSWTFSAKRKLNSIKTCSDLHSYVTNMQFMRDIWALLSAISLVLAVPILSLLAGGAAASNEGARNNAQYVFDKLCTDGGVR